MEKKQKIILLSIIGVLIMLCIIVLLIVSKKTPTNTTIIDEQNKQTETVVPKPITQIQNERNEIINTTRGFVEIYGTYTNTNDYKNIKDLYPFMTDSLISKYEKIISTYVRSENFYSKSTQVLSVNIPSYKNGDNTANAVVSSVEKVIDSTSKETISQKVYKINLIKDKDDQKWKVDEIK